MSGQDPAGEAPAAGRAVLRVLARHEVDYLLVGAWAVISHGYPRFTDDVDILAQPDGRNFARLARALHELDPDFRLPGGRSPQDVAELDWGLGNHVRVHTPHGPLDAHLQLEGISESYEELEKRSIGAEIGDLSIKVVGYDDLIRMKRAAGRPQDLADIAALEDARRER